MNGAADLERRLAHQLRIIHALGTSSPDFIYLFDRQHRFIYVSPPLLALWGKTLDEAVGKTFAELGYPRELVELHRRQLDEASTGKTVSGGNEYVNPQGRLGVYEYTFVPVMDEDGRVETIVGTTRDVTAQRRAEEERAAAIEKLAESERQFRDFADAMPQLAWIAHSDGFIFWYNRRWYDYTGTTPAQMEGWGWQSVHHPDELPRVLERWKGSIATGVPFEMTFPLRGADGRFRWFLTRVNPIRDASGAIVRWFGTNTDVDVERRALQERDAALAAARAAIEVREDFVAVASHELKTPLAALLLQLDALERSMGGEPMVARHGDRVRRAAHAGRRLERLIADLLDVSRLSAGKLRLEPQRIELTALLQEVCERFEARAPGRIRTRFDAPLVGDWDPLRLDQVATNILDNALKFGGKEPIEVEAERDGDHAVVRFVDHGVGIPVELQPHIFERFTRATSSRHFAGFGLGLWIAREIVAACGGAIAVRSAPGAGAEFTVTLPMAATPVASSR